MTDLPVDADLLALVITLTPEGDPNSLLPAWWGNAVNSLLIDSLALIDPDLVANIISANYQRPFTVSSLIGPMPARKFVPNRAYYLRFTALTRQLCQVMWLAVQDDGPLGAGKMVTLGDIQFQIKAIGWDPNQHPLAGWDSYHSMQSRSALMAAPARYTGFAFNSPTIFSDSSHEPKGLPFPLPELTFGSLLKRWNLFCSSSVFPEDVRRYAAKSMVLHSFETRSRTAIINQAVVLGMVGQAGYKAVHYDRYWMGIIQTLTDFAFFSGVGAKTALGMGQARRFVKSLQKKAG